MTPLFLPTYWILKNPSEVPAFSSVVRKYMVINICMKIKTYKYHYKNYKIFVKILIYRYRMYIFTRVYSVEKYIYVKQLTGTAIYFQGYSILCTHSLLFHHVLGICKFELDFSRVVRKCIMFKIYMKMKMYKHNYKSYKIIIKILIYRYII